MTRRTRPHWTAVQFSEQFTNDALPDLTGYVAVDVPDYQGNLNVSPSGVTLLRSIGTVRLFLRNVTAGANTYGAFDLRWGLAVIDKDQPVPDPANSQELVDERWLRVGSMVAESNYIVTNVSSGPPTVFMFEWDVTQRARLRDSQLVLAINTSLIGVAVSGTNLRFEIMTRSLLVGDIT